MTSLDLRIGFEPEVFDFYVSQAGNDTTGDGSLASPYKTASKAYTQIPSTVSRQWNVGIMDSGGTLGGFNTRILNSPAPKSGISSVNRIRFAACTGHDPLYRGQWNFSASDDDWYWLDSLRLSETGGDTNKIIDCKAEGLLVTDCHFCCNAHTNTGPDYAEGSEVHALFGGSSGAGEMVDALMQRCSITDWGGPRLDEGVGPKVWNQIHAIYYGTANGCIVEDTIFYDDYQTGSLGSEGSGHCGYTWQWYSDAINCTTRNSTLYNVANGCISDSESRVGQNRVEECILRTTRDTTRGGFRRAAGGSPDLATMAVKDSWGHGVVGTWITPTTVTQEGTNSGPNAGDPNFVSTTAPADPEERPSDDFLRLSGSSPAGVLGKGPSNKQPV
jgi:hypothetical protein